MHFPQGVDQPLAPPHPPPRDAGQRYVGHQHFWERALSRRQIIQTAAGGSAAIVGSGLLLPGVAQAANHASAAPKPIPEVLIPGTQFHILPPASEEPSSITDFNGFVGATEIQGTGTGGLLFDVDMRFMQGVYVGVDGRVHQGTFSFV